MNKSFSQIAQELQQNLSMGGVPPTEQPQTLIGQGQEQPQTLIGEQPENTKTFSDLANNIQNNVSVSSSMQLPPGVKPQTTSSTEMTKNLENEIPYGAIGLNPDGSADYGQGLEGFWNKIVSKVNEPTYYQDSAGEYQSTEKSPIAKIGTGAGAVLMGALEVFTWVQQEGFRNSADIVTLEQIADMTNEDHEHDWSETDFGTLSYWVDGFSPAGFYRAAQSLDKIKEGTRRLPDGTIDRVRKANQIWWENGSALGTNTVNAAAYEEYMKATMAGEDPLETLKEMANPTADFIAFVAFDIGNILIGGVGKIFKANKLLSLGKALQVTDELVDDVALLDKTVDVGEKIKVVNGMAGKVHAMTTDVGKTVTKISGSPFELIQSAKSGYISDKINAIMSPLGKQYAKQPGTMTDIVRSIIKIGSSNKKVVEEGLNDLLLIENGKLINLIVTPAGLQTAKFFNEMSSLGANIFEKDLIKVFKTNDALKISEILEAKTAQVMKKLFPSLGDIAKAKDEIKLYEAAGRMKDIPQHLLRFKDVEVPGYVLNIAKLHDLLQGKAGVRMANKAFSTVYIIMNPGVSMRNFSNNLMTAIVDSGPTAFIEIWDKSKNIANIQKMVGGVPRSVFRGFGKYGIGEAKEALLKKPGLIQSFVDKAGGLMQSVEEMASAVVESRSIRRTLGNSLREGASIASYEPLRKAGYSEAIIHRLDGLVKEHYGDVDEAISILSKEIGKGRVNMWRNMDIMFNEAELYHIRRFGNLYDEFAQVLRQSKTKNNAMKGMRELYETYIQKAVGDNTVSLASILDDSSLADDAAMKLIQELPDDMVSGAATDLFWNKVLARRQVTQKMDDVMRRIVTTMFGKDAPYANKLLDNYYVGVRKITEEATTAHQSTLETVKTINEEIVSNKQMTVTEIISMIRSEFPDIERYVPLNIKDKRIIRNDLWEFYRMKIADTYTGLVEKRIQEMDRLVKRIKLENGVDISKRPEFKQLQKYINQNYKVMQAKSYVDNQLISNEVESFIHQGRVDDAIVKMASELGIPTSTEHGAKIEKSLFTILNEFLPSNSLFRVKYNLTPEQITDITKLQDDVDNYWQLVDNANKKHESIVAKITNIDKNNKSLLKQLDSDKMKAYIELDNLRGLADNAEGKLATAKETVGIPLDERFVKPVTVKRMSDLKKLEFSDAFEALNSWSKERRGSAIHLDMFDRIINDPPVIGNMQPTWGQINRENFAGVKKAFGLATKNIDEKWGKSELATKLSKDQLSELLSWKSETAGRVAKTKAMAIDIASEERDFTLLNYENKRAIDLVAAYVMPYQFWYSRSYKNWAQRIAMSPQLMVNYAKYRKALAKINEDKPEFLRNQIDLKDFLPIENPIIFNLEASLNPLNGLTGVDFNDRRRVVGTPGTFQYTWTSILNDVGKYGPGVWTPINWLTAGYLWSQNEDDAASRWAGRAIPQTAQIKALGSKFGKVVELDPMVALFNWGSWADPYEKRRVGRALISLYQSKDITIEQAYEAARTQEGEIWNKALVLATDQRSGSALASFTLGQGFKPRGKVDIEIDTMFEEYYQFWQNADKFTPADRKIFMDDMRERYPYMDTILLTLKDGAEKDKTYAYAILGRIAPAQLSDIAGQMGLPKDLYSKFYEDGGNMTSWNAIDKEQFMNSMVALGSLLKMPDNITKREWTQASIGYSEIKTQMKKQFGDDIIDVIQSYYDTKENINDEEMYLDAHPRLRDALEYQKGAIANTPVVAKYYNGLYNFEQYYDAKFRKQVVDTIDPNFFVYMRQRTIIVDENKLKEFDSQIGWKQLSKKYYDMKSAYDSQLEIKLRVFGKQFQDDSNLGMQLQNINKEDLSVTQKSIIEKFSTPVPQKISWTQVKAENLIPEYLDISLFRYFAEGKQLSYAEKTTLTRLANNINFKYDLGLSSDELLSIASLYYSNTSNP